MLRSVYLHFYFISLVLPAEAYIIMCMRNKSINSLCDTSNPPDVYFFFYDFSFSETHRTYIGLCFVRVIKLAANIIYRVKKSHVPIVNKFMLA